MFRIEQSKPKPLFATGTLGIHWNKTILVQMEYIWIALESPHKEHWEMYLSVLTPNWKICLQLQTKVTYLSRSFGHPSNFCH